MEWSIGVTVLPHPLQYSDGVGFTQKGQVLVTLLVCRQLLEVRVIETSEAGLTGLAQRLLKHLLIEHRIQQSWKEDEGVEDWRGGEGGGEAVQCELVCLCVSGHSHWQKAMFVLCFFMYTLS